MLIVATLISAMVQIAVVLAIAGLVYAAFGRKAGFRRYVGLYRAPLPIVLIGTGIGIVIAATAVAFPSVRAIAGGEGTAIAAALSGHGSGAAWVALVVTALFKTAVSEEILFRGLIAKASIRWLGFRAGNVLQAAIFGFVHLALLAVAKVDHFILFALCVNAGVLGWIAGWLNERHAKGSILPGYALHASANLVTYCTIALLFGR
ncbi:lysostaphin resistance A-like protein [Rhodanobacter sp. Si-c]|uniref:Lysostaphin resistance A-like protein n=1 Tax=Rhodanobacter lycopersici TaxID=3162487 RepID=A0ABV3Q8J1_9GAMM